MAREMKNSGAKWIGEIPKSWSLTRMKTCILRRDSGAWGEEANGKDGDLICLRIADFDYSRLTFKDKEISELTVRHYNKQTIEKILLEKNDLLVEKSGGGEKTPVGRMVIFDKDYPALYANFMDRLRCSEGIVPKWFLYIFTTFYLNRYSWNYIKQTTGIQNLDLTSMLSNEIIPIPKIEEQQRIADYLDTECAEIDSVLEKTRASIEEYKKLKHATIAQAITKGIRFNRVMKDSGSVWFGDVPTEWNMSKLKYLFHIKKDIAGEEGHTILSITQRGIVPKDISKNEGQLAESYSKYQLVEPGDFAMNHMDLLTGWVDISKYNGVTSPDYRVFVLNDTVSNSSHYYLYMMQMCYSNRIFYGLGQGVSGLGRWRLQADKFLNFVIAVPPTEEQIEIANYLDKKCAEIDILISKKQQFLTELETYKKSLIYEYVTGKKEVR